MNFDIRRLGSPRFKSPLDCNAFIDDGAAILLDPTLDGLRADLNVAERDRMERAGPREKLFFEPGRVRAAIVTCGGLCPGLNDVIRALTMVLWYQYGVRDILGIRYGYQGLVKSMREEPLALTPELVSDIHQHGGTILGSSRGNQEPGAMADTLQELGIGILFAVGGDGTQRGAWAVVEEIKRRGLDVAVVGIPKTIDNDLLFTERTFGFETAVAMCLAPISAAHMEAKGVRNGVGLVKLMGRESGFVAAYAALASSDVNLVLVPEVPFRMEQVLKFLEARLERKRHAVIVVAEGAGQDYVSSTELDASGNKKLGDVGSFLNESITAHFAKHAHPAAVKYIAPSYTIRSARANADDSVFCFQLSENAVHAAMAGYTGLVVGLWNGQFVHVPMVRAIEARKRIDPSSLFWQSVLHNTGQPHSLS